MNPHEAAGRQRKVAALVAYLLDALAHAPSADTREAQIAGAVRWCDRADDAMWQTVADLAGVHVPSEVTRAAVAAHLAGMLRAERRMREGADPFAGLFPEVAR